MTGSTSRYWLAALLMCAGACSKSHEDSAADGGGSPVQVQARALLANVDGYSYGEIFRVSHTANNAANLTQFQVQVKLDTATEIAAA